MKSLQIKRNLLLLLLAAAMMLGSCRKDNDLFKGEDNFITSFTLKIGETIFTAAFTDSTITVTAPEGFSLDSAKAEVKLSENASIYPDPSEITEWNDEMQFVVKAYNGTQKIYRYKVDRKSIYEQNSVVLTTQADVDAFGQQGVTEIGGSLIIGSTAGTDSITSLAALYRLKRIDYSLIINPTYAARDVVGLDNLSTIGDALQVQSVDSLSSLALPKLETVGSIYIKSTGPLTVDFPSLSKVSKSLDLEVPLAGASFPALREVGGKVTYYSGTNSATYLPIISFPSLKQAGSLMFYYFTNVTKIELPELEKTGDIDLMNLPKLYEINCAKLQMASGTISIPATSSLTEVSFPELVICGGLKVETKTINTLDLPLLKTVSGDISVSYASLDGIRSLTSLTEVTGELLLGELPKMNGLGIPASLKNIGKLTLNNRTVVAPAEINVKGLNIGELNLQVGAPVKLIGDDIFKGTLTVNPSLLTTFPTLEGFKEVDSIGFGGYIAYINDLQIKGIEKIDKGFWMPNNNVRIFSMPDLKEVVGDFTINHFNQVTQPVVEFPKLQKVGGSFNVKVESTDVTTLQFPDLSSIGGDCMIGTGFDNRCLSTLLFPSLATVGRKLTIYAESYPTYSNTRIVDLNGFSALKQVDSVEVNGQAALVSFEGLKSALSSFTAANWSASNNAYNPSYSDLVVGKWTKP